MSNPEPGATSPADWEPRPVPEVTPETAPFWEGAVMEELLLGYCPDCDCSFFYPRARCPSCLVSAEFREAAGTGTIYSYSVPAKISGWPDAHLPLVVAYVELDEGPRMVTNVIDCDPAAVEVGAPVAVTFISTEDPMVSIPVFRLHDG